MADAPGLVDWGLAERIAVRAAGREPFASSYHADSLHPDFAELTQEAEALVIAETGLVSAYGPARARVTDRKGWIQANVASFQRLLRPLTDKFVGRVGTSPFSSFTRSVAAAEVGALLGWMSTRVLGQYDLLVIEDERPRGPGPRLLRGPQRARPREALRLPAPRVPPLAGAPRGHPPGPVHRRPVAARALPRPGPADPRVRRPRPGSPRRGHGPGQLRGAARAATRCPTAASPACSPRPSRRSCSTRWPG